MRNLIKLFSGLIISLIIFSCSPSTELIDIYSDQAFAGKEFKKILVLGITTDEWKKKVYENEFRSQFLNYDVEVLMAWQELPKGEQLNRETFEKYFREKNVDAILVAIEGGESSDKTLYSGGGSSHVYVGFYGFYASTASYYFNSEFLAEEKIVHMRTNLYETTEGKIIWSAKSQSFEPKNTGDVVKAVSHKVVNEINLMGYIK
ncbi:MAG: hypothetical protein MUE91_01990 [Ignavibacteriaceae bacterium]|jgi:hypothetical protein|nr:hypothetical protein [Ignavibacteriaceae bacterium]MCU0406754.1 hypothetical protein [Ignavibacteriaceae bacterium]MCU0413164.1 hypothetical protein [Ignavibacteriaceae bacterium]